MLCVLSGLQPYFLENARGVVRPFCGCTLLQACCLAIGRSDPPLQRGNNLHGRMQSLYSPQGLFLPCSDASLCAHHAAQRAKVLQRRAERVILA